jgi:hypothetical protein
MKHCLIWQWLHEVLAPGYSLWDQVGKLCKKHNNRVGLWRLAWKWKKSDDCPLSETLKAPHFYRRRNHVIAPSPWDFNIDNKAIRNNRNSPRDPTLPRYTTIYRYTMIYHDIPWYTTIYHDPSCINVAHLPFPLVPLVPWCFPLPSIGDPIVLQMMVTTKHPAPAIQTYEWLMPHHGGHTGPKVLRMIDLLWLVYACRVEHVNLSIWSIQMNLI